ncbi:F0F1 ATP synthase subunit delta [Methylophaga sp. OBS4]|uniref:F0F1 ATP synthase subunit delta n=1 Tax=Methylophaga sp. OBS4 TaxID=2991935 RepID=UPI0022501667|nr:F0F1 ATP synthase subunit delta [Methylophaga sp. OBS4]MCX4186474.1 F0F1 ATP synthase subunit delta [Methylophaga sp. OBS4]
MELNWSTFVLEIINFLVLVWLLKHFLYKPVREVIARRQAGIEKTLADAEARYAETRQLQQQYESRLADWDRERQQKRETLRQELDDESQRQQQELQTRLQQEQEKVQVTAAKRQHDRNRKMEETALQHGASFAAKLLHGLSGPDTEARLVDKLVHDLSQLSAEKTSMLRSHYGENLDKFEVASAYPLSSDLQQQIEQALHTVTGLDMPVSYSQDSSLIAGLRVGIGSWVINANIQDELSGFAELAHDG